MVCRVTPSSMAECPHAGTLCPRIGCFECKLKGQTKLFGYLQIVGALLSKRQPWLRWLGGPQKLQRPNSAGPCSWKAEARKGRDSVP
ncbi:hypothetical protein IWW34DRAFT_720284 [Fusarium oxysporum f. sp. albedinis]|nr:hypothetical protein IWW34DRAFT_720284 [Fusarium oxysporum f. sp. albedinis]